MRETLTENIQLPLNYNEVRQQLEQGIFKDIIMGVDDAWRQLVQKVNPVIQYQIPDVREYGTLAKAVETANASSLTTLCKISETAYVADDLTIPTNLILYPAGGLISVDTGKTLTINSPFAAGRFQVFTGAGTVEFGIGAVQLIHPEWWGEFPNNSDDTAILSKAINAANIADGVYTGGSNDAILYVGPGNYYINPDGLPTISTHFHAPQAFFRATAKETQSAYIFAFDTGDATERGYRHIHIGTIAGFDILSDVPHYCTGITIKDGGNQRIIVGSLQGLYTGLSMNGAAYEVHQGVSQVDINTMVGCDYGLQLSSGSSSEKQNEASHFRVNWAAYCDYAVHLLTTTGDGVIAGNVFEFNWLELHCRDNQVGFYIDGPETKSNIFKVNGCLTMPTGASGRILITKNGASDNSFDLPYWDFSKVSDDGTGANNWPLDGKMRVSLQAGMTNTAGRSTIMCNTPPTTIYCREGDKFWYDTPSAGFMGWVQTADGKPGTRQKFGLIFLEGSTTWDPGSIADGDEEAKDITVSGAELGDFVMASFSLDVADLCLTADVTAANTVTCVLANNTGGAVDLGEGTLRVRVIKK